MISDKQIQLLDASMAAVLPRADLRELDGKRLFLTGGTGFFGVWLLTAFRMLRQHGICTEVVVLSRNPDAFLTRYPQFLNAGWLRFVAGNVRDFAADIDVYDLLIHAATETSMSAHADAMNMFDDIVLGSRRVLEFAESCRVRKLLLVSSGAVYGPQPIGMTHQPDESALACNPAHPASAYGEGKRVMELLGAITQQRSGIEVSTARCFAFSGPALAIDAHFAIGNFVRDALFRSAITVQGDGLPLRSYLHGADLAAWLLTILLRGESGLSYNVGSDEAIGIHELAMLVRDVLAPQKPVIVMRPVADGADRVRPAYVPAVTRARGLGCTPWTPLADSIRAAADYVS